MDLDHHVLEQLDREALTTLILVLQVQVATLMGVRQGFAGSQS